LLNEASRTERDQYLKAAPFERSAELVDYWHFYKYPQISIHLYQGQAFALKQFFHLSHFKEPQVQHLTRSHPMYIFVTSIFISACLLQCNTVYAQTKFAAGAANTPVATATQTQIMKAGLWQHTIVNETAGSRIKRTAVSQTCYATEDTKSIIRMLPPQQELGSKCEVSKLVFQADSANWQITCKGKEYSIAGASTMTMTTNSYTGTATLVRKAAGKSVNVTQTMSGKLLGSCK
jgi:hypothetical protein